MYIILLPCGYATDNYHTLVIANEETKQTIAVQVSAKNLTQAKEEAGKVGRVICVACEKGSKINF